MKYFIVLIITAISVSFSFASNPIEPVKNKTEITPETLSNNDEVKAIHLTTQAFKEKVFNYDKNKDWKYEGDLPCIIDFYTVWCGPCKRIAPVLEDLAKEYDGKIIVYKINTEEEQELAQAFGIRSIPTLLFVPLNGQPQMSNGMSKDQLIKTIDNVLLKKE